MPKRLSIQDLDAGRVQTAEIGIGGNRVAAQQDRLALAAIQRVRIQRAGGFLGEGRASGQPEAKARQYSHWSQRIRPPYASTPSAYYAVTEQAVAERTKIWDGFGAAYELATETPVALRGGDVESGGMHLFSIADRTVSMRDLLTDLGSPLQERIVHALLTAIELDESGTRVTRCVLSANGGEVLARPRVLILACGRGALRLTWVQRGGGRPMKAEAFLRGAPIAVGSRLGEPCPATG